MIFKIELTPQQMQVVWEALLELPGKRMFATAESVKRQVEIQEADAKSHKETKSGDSRE